MSVTPDGALADPQKIIVADLVPEAFPVRGSILRC
jgi:hypothetical protein